MLYYKEIEMKEKKRGNGTGAMIKDREVSIS